MGTLAPLHGTRPAQMATGSPGLQTQEWATEGGPGRPGTEAVALAQMHEDVDRTGPGRGGVGGGRKGDMLTPIVIVTHTRNPGGFEQHTSSTFLEVGGSAWLKARCGQGCAFVETAAEDLPPGLASSQARPSVVRP